MTVQPTRKDEREFGDLQASLDAYFKKQLTFDELRTQWILTLSDNPEMCSGAVRLLYQESANRHLSENRAITLKRIVEASFRDGPDDITVVFEDNAPTLPVRPIAATRESQRAIRTAPKLGPGRVLKDRFVLEEPLGEGGIGVVFRAKDRLRQPAGDGRGKIAVKVLRNKFQTNAALRSALQREALQAQSLSHPNIVRVHDFHEDGETRFLTMELVEGKLLSTVLSERQPATLPRDRAMRIIAGMCQGLSHAHECGLVHADFKPGNVILAAGDVPKILDFGLSHIEAPDDHANDRSSAGAATGPLRAMTPAYSSCNRLEGGTPCFSDDVYSLSCVIYEILSGRHPYERKSALVARELDLQPPRIDGLTPLQWRTLAAGLQPSSDARTTQVYDIQEAFSATSPIRALKIPPVREEDGEGKSGSSLSRLLLAAVLVSAAVILVFQFAPSKYLDRVRNAELIQSLQTAVFDRANESDATGEAPSTPSPEPAKPAPEIRAAVPVVPASPGDAGAEAGRNASDAVAGSVGTVGSVEEGMTSASSEEATLEEELPSGEVTPEDLAPIAAAADTRTFRLDATEYFVPESGTALAVQVVRQGDVSSAAVVEWYTVADSAEPDVDYVDLGRRQLNFAAGEESKTVFIPIVSDAFVERNEYFRIALRQPGVDSSPAQSYAAIVTIIDDDL